VYETSGLAEHDVFRQDFFRDLLTVEMRNRTAEAAGADIGAGEAVARTFLAKLGDWMKATASATNKRMIAPVVQAELNFLEYVTVGLRFAQYCEYMDQMERDLARGGDGRPDNFGASVPEEVMAHVLPDGKPDLVRRAFKLANELIGP